MAVFNSTQAAFRASVTQAEVLESGRATMDLMTADLRAMAPSHGQSNAVVNGVFIPGAANFVAWVTGYALPPSPLIQPLVGGGGTRTNVLENFFILSRQNQTWTGVGYAVNTSSSSALYPLYRFSMSASAAFSPWLLYSNFNNALGSGAWTNMSHLMDGVVALTVRPYDVNGGLMTNDVTYSGGQYVTNENVFYFLPALGQVGFVMFSNTLPASVEIEMGVLEDRTLQRAESLSGSFQAQSNYLAGSAGAVHVFRQRIAIPNVDPAAYQ
jgi:hypothetical protein